MAKRPRVPNYKVQAQVRKQKAISNLVELYEGLSPKEVVKAFNKSVTLSQSLTKTLSLNKSILMICSLILLASQ